MRAGLLAVLLLPWLWLLFDALGPGKVKLCHITWVWYVMGIID